jgi:hypothetical protein
VLPFNGRLFGEEEIDMARLLLMLRLVVVAVWLGIQMIRGRI